MTIVWRVKKTECKTLTSAMAGDVSCISRDMRWKMRVTWLCVLYMLALLFWRFTASKNKYCNHSRLSFFSHAALVTQQIRHVLGITSQFSSKVLSLPFSYMLVLFFWRFMAAKICIHSRLSFFSQRWWRSKYATSSVFYVTVRFKRSHFTLREQVTIKAHSATSV